MSVKSETSSYVAQQDLVLSGEMIYLIPDHFDQLTTTILYDKAEVGP